MKKQLKSDIFLLTAAIVWGFAFVTQCMVDDDILGAISFNALRYALGGFCMFPVIWIFEKEERNIRKFRKTLLYGVITGVVLFFASITQMYGINMVKSSGKSGFLTGLYIVLVPFYSSLLYKKRVTLKEWIAAIIAVAGLYFLSVTDGFGNISKGDIMLVVGALFWALHIICVDFFVEKVSPVKYSCVQFFTCSLCCFILVPFFEKITLNGIAVNLLPILYTGVLSTGVGYTCQVVGQKDANPNAACIIMSLEGVFSAIGGALVLGERMTARGYFGCALMFLGAILSQIKIEKSKIKS